MEINFENHTIQYSEDVKELEVPDLSNKDKVAYRLQIILSSLGEDVFEEVNNLLDS